jgi:hypothetical protein
LTWNDNKAAEEQGRFQMDIAVANAPAVNDVLVCEECIRGIKRIPFSDLATAAT